MATFYLTKNENIFNQKILNVALILLLWVKEQILPKNTDILKKKMLISAKSKGSWLYKVYF